MQLGIGIQSHHKFSMGYPQLPSYSIIQVATVVSMILFSMQMVEQRRKLPPLINDRALFTKAAPYGDKEDPFYHSPSNKIGNNYSPQSMHAAAILFEEFPAVS